MNTRIDFWDAMHVLDCFGIRSSNFLYTYRSHFLSRPTSDTSSRNCTSHDLDSGPTTILDDENITACCLYGNGHNHLADFEVALPTATTADDQLLEDRIPNIDNDSCDDLRIHSHKVANNIETDIFVDVCLSKTLE